MRFEGTLRVRAPRERVWSFFLNPREFSACIDDPHTIEIQDEDHFRGTVKAGVSFIRGTFTVSATVKERAPFERAQIEVHGSGMSSAFDIVATLVLLEASGITTMHWASEVQMTGPIANVGARILQGTTEKKTTAFFENARRILEAD